MSIWSKPITPQKEFFWIAFLLIVIAEALSLITYQGAPALEPYVFVLVIAGTLYLAFQNIEYGLLIAFGELFIGSFGHLFGLEVGSFQISIRIALFLLLNAMFFLHRLYTRSYPFRTSRYFWVSNAFFALIVYGFVLAFVNQHARLDIFHDADAYLFFAYFPIAFAAFRTKESRDRLAQVFCAALLWLGFQTALVLFAFSHHFRDAMEVLYLWIRDARIGEITRVAGDFYRIFFQSYIFALVGIFIFAIQFFRGKTVVPGTAHTSFASRRGLWLYTLSAFLVLESLSRSFWFGGVIAVLVMLGTLLAFRTPWGVVGRGILRMIGGTILALALIFAIVNFPFPPKGPPILLADIFGGRAVALFGEAAASSRWQLLPAMWQEIKAAPLLGHGFGKTITYKTDDPRYLAEDPTGMRTTFAFEWGYLDLWLKLGLPGALVYGWLIVLILRQGWRRIKQFPQATEYGLWLGVIALLAAHFFTPYLNHPLGIGLLILAAAWFDSHEHVK
ncbi:O-antigen ligase family protein [Candidatus Uhrbacteria bacterium]|nr:O-antigen ligase family protein [Candidatus Uhrbacteria bacterium]